MLPFRETLKVVELKCFKEMLLSAISHDYTYVLTDPASHWIGDPKNCLAVERTLDVTRYTVVNL